MEFIAITEEIEANKYTPVNVVFTLVSGEEGYLLVQNRESDYWELPAGCRLQGEDSYINL